MTTIRTNTDNTEFSNTVKNIVTEEADSVLRMIGVGDNARRDAVREIAKGVADRLGVDVTIHVKDM